MVQGRWRKGMLRVVFTQAALTSVLTGCEMQGRSLSPRDPGDAPQPAPVRCSSSEDIGFELGPSSPGPTILGKTMVPHDQASEQAQKWYMQKGMQKAFTGLFPKEAAAYESWCQAPLPAGGYQAQLQAVNDRVESRMNYAWDNRFFANAKEGEGDFWLAPFLSHLLKSGDCEDKAIAKQGVLTCTMPAVRDSYIVWVTISDNTAYEGPNGVKTYTQKITGHHAILAAPVGGSYFLLDNDNDGKGSVRAQVARTAPAVGIWTAQYNPLYVFGAAGAYHAAAPGESLAPQPAPTVCLGVSDRRNSFGVSWPQGTFNSAARAIFSFVEGRLQPIVRQAAEPRIFLEEDHMLAARHYVWIGRQEALLSNPRNADGYARFLAQFDTLKTAPLAVAVRAIDAFVNDKDVFALATAQSTYGQANYIAAPVETVAKGAGDAAALAVLKLDILRHIGVPEAQRFILTGAGGDAVVAVRDGKSLSLVMRAPDTDPCGLTGKLGYAANEHGVWRVRAAVVCPKENKRDDARLRSPNLARR